MTVKVSNFTPFANLRYSNTLHDGREFGILMLKASFDIQDDGSCKLSEEQEPINFRDRFHGELNVSSLRHPSEFVPWKPGTDIILNATAYAPGGEATSSFLAGIRVKNGERVLDRIVKVTGKRYWIPKWKSAVTDEQKHNWQQHRNLFDRWELSDPEPITHLPIRYEYAYGGTIPKGQDEQGNPVLDAYEHNPVGCGWIDPEWTDHTQKVVAPQIGDKDVPINDWKKHYIPHGLGPIPPVWLPRRPLGGTYDQKWLTEVWPRWPADYRFDYHHSAARGLDIKPRIDGDFELVLANLHKDKKQINIEYKDFVPHALFYPDDGSQAHGQRYLLDTVHLSDDLSQMFLVWRTLYDMRIDQKIEIWTSDQDVALDRNYVRKHFNADLRPEDFAFHLENNEEKEMANA